ncbi:hypothetical protein E2C01_093395 [Portunus trituberculatus]|uniref:Uncharacterized protein n=1 Tax=Portunus trituberculatus TaxID=210409 RepID=A0A5B7JTW3_PORTR|nr:hypothetical protein [Portunus trituberculatus]
MAAITIRHSIAVHKPNDEGFGSKEEQGKDKTWELLTQYVPNTRLLESVNGEVTYSLPINDAAGNTNSRMLVTEPAFPITERAQSLKTNLRVGLRPHHTPHTGKARPHPLELYPVPFYC